MNSTVNTGKTNVIKHPQINLQCTKNIYFAFENRSRKEQAHYGTDSIFDLDIRWLKKKITNKGSLQKWRLRGIERTSR
jgi:hypothetical protein